MRNYSSHGLTLSRMKFINCFFAYGIRCSMVGDSSCSKTERLTRWLIAAGCCIAAGRTRTFSMCLLELNCLPGVGGLAHLLNYFRFQPLFLVETGWQNMFEIVGFRKIHFEVDKDTYEEYWYSCRERRSNRASHWVWNQGIRDVKLSFFKSFSKVFE